MTRVQALDLVLFLDGGRISTEAHFREEQRTQISWHKFCQVLSVIRYLQGEKNTVVEIDSFQFEN